MLIRFDIKCSIKLIYTRSNLAFSNYPENLILGNFYNRLTEISRETKTSIFSWDRWHCSIKFHRLESMRLFILSQHGLLRCHSDIATYNVILVNFKLIDKLPLFNVYLNAFDGSIDLRKLQIRRASKFSLIFEIIQIALSKFRSS